MYNEINLSYVWKEDEGKVTNRETKIYICVTSTNAHVEIMNEKLVQLKKV